MYDRKIGLISSGIFYVVFVHVQYSHYIKNDILAVFLGTLSFLYCVYLLKRRERRDYLLAGVSAGLAASTHYAAALFFVPLLAAHFLVALKERTQDRFPRLISAGIFLGTLAFVFGFLIGTPYWVLSFSEFAQRFQKDKATTFSAYGNPFSDENGVPSWKWYTEYLASSGLFYPIFFASVGGLLYALKRHSREDILLLSFPTVYTLFLFGLSFRTDRLSMPLGPFLSLLGALFIVYIYKYASSRLRIKEYRKLLAVLLLLVFVGVPFLRVLLFDSTLAAPDTREVALEWMEENIPENQTLFMLEGSPMLIGHQLRKRNYANVMNIPNFDTKMVFKFPGELAVIGKSDYHIARNYRTSPYYKPRYENYRLLIEHGELVKEFSNPLYERGFFAPISLEASATVNNYHNPTIQIYRIPTLEGVSSFSSKSYYAEEMQNFTEMVRVSDREAERGVALFSSLDVRADVSGPYRPIPRGDYSVLYRVKAGNNSIEEIVAGIDIRSATGKIYAEKNIYGVNFTYSGTYQEFVLPLELPQADILAFRFVSYGKTRLWLDKIELRRAS
jgi:hypothetical protein